ncbi:uncharacterized protein LMH87_008018 [Akanthomyces muscarius]|uniref:Uncharacterized protein n=1 Tax=Akanthomyces muscarius TaxID=2231603 RepID=A0A9W8QJL4_AKAMU|nr:uncharacterized protein LMH87_008018 [Akanthomyces muscarius]KAJ4159101.1 hypothetical protein LMH87_008018 [Akanthomyces muscarius]
MDKHKGLDIAVTARAGTASEQEVNLATLDVWLVDLAMSNVTKRSLVAKDEALEYYACIMAPMHEYHGDGDSAYEFSHDNNVSQLVADKDFDGDTFTMHILTHRLQCLFSSRRIAPRYGVMPELKPLWARLFNLISIVIQKLNLCIATPDVPLKALRYIRKLMYTELCFAVPSWRAHAEGFGALIKSYSYGLSELLSPQFRIVQYPLLVASMCNTTSPPNDQIEHMSNWSDDDIVIAYGHTGSHSFPCPTAVFQAMIRITYLRTLVAANKNAPEWEGVAREAYAKIQSVDPHRWGEAYPTDDDIYILAARVYQASVALYAILALPSRLAAVFTFPLRGEEHMATTADASIAKTSSGTSDGHDQSTISDGVDVEGLQHKQRDKLGLVHAALEEDSSQTARVRYRSRLFRLFRQATLELPESGGLMWPSAVLGVALQDHKEEQAILLDHIGYLRGWPESENGATCLYDKLVMFWGSGKKHWDQCFYEPTSVMT